MRRNEIAACGEKAYATLPIRDAATLLFFTELNDLLAFASAVSTSLVYLLYR